jgi:hypothetical protein
MGMVTHRGRVTELEPFGKRDGRRCRVGKIEVRLHRDLAAAVGEGDEVYLAGKYAKAKGLLTALAVNNVSRGERKSLDATNNMLLVGLLGWLGLQSAALLPMFTDRPLLWALFLVPALFGIGGMFRSIRELILINRAAKWVRYPDLP